MIPKIGQLIVKSGVNEKWFDILHVAKEAAEYQMEYIGGSGDKKEYRLFQKMEAGFCYKSNCFGVTPEDAFIKQAKEKDALFSVTIKAIF